MPAALPPLTHATKLTARTARVGFDWPDPAMVLGKLAEETAGLRAELEGGDAARIAAALGDMLFVLASRARRLGQRSVAEIEADWQAVKRSAT